MWHVEICVVYLDWKSIDGTILLALRVEINAEVYSGVANNYRDVPQNVEPRSPDVAPLFTFIISRELIKP